MPKVDIIEAGAYDPDEKSEVSEAALLEAVAAASEEVERLRAIRVEVRDKTPRSQVAAKLAETDDEFVAAIDALNAAERAVGRFRRTDQNVQHVSVGSAEEKEGKADK